MFGLYISLYSDINALCGFIQESESASSLKHENEKLREDMEQLVTENVLLLKENKQLQEDNLSLEEKVRCLEQENKRLHQEHKDALGNTCTYFFVPNFRATRPF